MLRRVQRYIAQNALLSPGGKVLVCVSGGADSVALLDVLSRAGYTCFVAHCNFHLRGEESMRDERFVRALAERMGVTLEVVDFDTMSYARSHAVGIEVAARELRYAWFAEVARTHGCEAIAVAHHQHDQAETVLMNLRRGAGLKGLCGMRPIAKNPVREDSVPVVRPLLCTTRDYIEYYLRSKRHIDWVTDSTNGDTTIHRNAIREELRHYSKVEIEHICQTADRMQGYQDLLEGKDTRAAGMARLYEELKDYGFAEIDKIYDALQRGVGGKVFTSKTHRAEIKHRKLCITTVS